MACETALLSNTLRTPSVGRRAATQLAHVTDADEHPVLPPFMRFSKVVEGRILARCLLDRTALGSGAKDVAKGAAGG